MPKKELVRRYCGFIVSLFLAALGVSLVIRAELGTSPAAGLVYVLNLRWPQISIGVFTVLFNVALIVGQILLLRRRFQLFQLLQLPMSFLLGGFTDLAMWIVSFLHPERYWERMIVLLAGCVVMAVSVSLAVTANVLMNSGEAFVKALADTTEKVFGTVKVFYDFALVAATALISWILLGSICGVREGTLIVAALVGSLSKQIIPRMERLNLYQRG